jgi:hypothetical protein
LHYSIANKTGRGNFIHALIQAVLTKPLLHQALWGWENTAQNKTQSLAFRGSESRGKIHRNNYATRQTVIRAIIEVGKKKKGIGEQEMKDWSQLVGMGSWEKKL